MTESQRLDKREMANIHIILICLCSLMIMYEYNYPSNMTEVQLKHPMFSLLGPYNTSEILTNDVYGELIDISKFSFKKNPNPCKYSPAGFLLVVIISSNPNNAKNRMIIRNTWGKSVDSTKVVFLMGEPDNSTIAERINRESKVYGDIVQGSFVDAYRNMTYKHVMGLKWVAHHCPVAKYILKTDDDVVVNSREMRRFLAQELSPWGAKGLIACQVLKHAEAQRSDTSKWKVTTAEYSFNYYPTYCAGWAILYSQDVIPRLLEAAQAAPYFWIDDVHITGVVAEKIGVPRTSLSSQILSQKKVDLMKNLGPRYLGNFVLGPPDLSAETMIQLWKAIPA